ncbi:gamma-glutamyl kinase [Parasedimentitalea huanghaiensis]|uniref:Gamma-glutamyl kinase n=1 Tax=Parasedimentitalea huanghaiensis TaxID=2682100 RepID=A0A6L6W9J2_9RHOB|nr:gamma-glutamyl kinase [Zongyanglinia huanghaiensis]MVO14486.1 gamma-glutamyl kinase [Zongyanglinia huanghaiensis]
MLVFFKERLVLLSVPKTGTTALHTALRARADMVISSPPDLKHAPLYRYNRWVRPMFQRVCDAEMEVVAVMREPISWLGSWYRFRRRPFMLGKDNATTNIEFDEFVRAYCKGKQPPFANVGSQAVFLAAQPNGCSVNHLFKYEKQERLIAFLQQRLNTEICLKKENVSPVMELSLSSKTETILRRKYADEFTLYRSIGL